MPKRGAQGNGSIRQRPDGRWEARFVVGYDAGTGKQIRKSVYADTQKEVRQKLNAAVKAVDEGAYFEPSKITVGQWLDTWTDEYLGAVKPRTVSGYKDNCRIHLKPKIGAIRLSALKAPTIQKVYNDLQKGIDGKNPLSAKTIKNIHGTLHKALQQAKAIGLIANNPADACKLPRIEQKEMHPLDDIKIQAFLTAIKGHEFERVYYVSLFTGMRQGEVLGLTWDCIDFTSGTILVDKQLQKSRDGAGLYYFIAPKNNKPRLITPAKTVMAVLKEQRRVQAEARMKAGPLWEKAERWGKKDLVFTDGTGHNLSAQTVYLKFKEIVKQIGAPETRFHDLRHTYAVPALKSGDNVKNVQENLGHHTAAFTLDTYAHSTAQMKRESANIMERYIEAVENL